MKHFNGKNSPTPRITNSRNFFNIKKYLRNGKKFDYNI